ncbi:DUF4253 domain-containing protein [Opitutus terrae]|uniref:DUF4253 domain-containing protein n=1 Tax=Opitutus terrae TaxID=107709 RepID=UPI0013052EC0|nr:DUF4253 domain-containing protein [Opitutus terrae]
MSVPGAEAVVAWRRYQTEWRKEGASAVVLGDADELKIRADLLASEPVQVSALLSAAANTTAAAFFRAREAEYIENELVVEPGQWPASAVPPSPLTAHTDVGSGQPKPVVYLAKIPTPHTWEVPAYLNAGGWNDCPDPASQVAVLKYWHDKHGAEIYSLTGDVLECLVTRPPSTRQAALALAQEQFLFCADVVHQGTESIEVLAATLLNSEVWYFWWD